MIATLTKVYMEPNHNSMVSLGMDCTGPVTRLIMHEDCNEIISVNSLQDIQVGDMIHVGNVISFLKTSQIKKIILINNIEVVFETQTSIYRLSKRVK